MCFGSNDPVAWFQRSSVLVPTKVSWFQRSSVLVPTIWCSGSNESVLVPTFEIPIPHTPPPSSLHLKHQWVRWSLVGGTCRMRQLMPLPAGMGTKTMKTTMMMMTRWTSSSPLPGKGRRTWSGNVSCGKRQAQARAVAAAAAEKARMVRVVADQDRIDWTCSRQGTERGPAL